METLPGADAPELPPVAAPTLALLGEKDPYLSERAMHASEEFVTGGWRYERRSGAGQPERVNELLLDFLEWPQTESPAGRSIGSLSPRRVPRRQ